MYTYDANGNRATKTTAYGTITYTYDAENRLLKTCGSGGVGVEYAYDNNGNLLSQTSSLKHSIYEPTTLESNTHPLAEQLANVTATLTMEFLPPVRSTNI